jgi:hypothetical protein
LTKIESIEWSAGQATGQMRRDMNDWHVSIWFDHDDPTKSESKRRIGLRHPRQDVHVFGPSRPMAVTKAFAHQVADSLIAAGAPLSLDENGHGPFVRKAT